jgi:hypothetical protein
MADMTRNGDAPPDMYGYVVPDATRQFFAAAGFAYLPGLLSAHVNAIGAAFEELFADSASWQGARRRVGLPAIATRHPLLRDLLANPVAPAVEQLLGLPCSYVGGDGTVFLNDDSYWHRDDDNRSAVIVKAAAYLEPTPRGQGLRFIPGSHGKGTEWGELENNTATAEEHFGVPAADLPAVTVPMNPGDVVVFDIHIMHAFYGVSGRRRQVAWCFATAPADATASAEMRQYLLAGRSVR